ncbi:MAG: DNA recombination protein RmuC [Bacteroidaceae bacterium]|nr:DNA recombination protein RmuC [Bacteroidaceae bacterium]
MELTYLLYLIIGIALGALAVFFAMRAQVQAGKERIALTEQQKQQEGDSLRQQMRDQQETFRQQMQALQESQQQQMRDGRESFQQQLRSQQESQQQQMAQQMALLREQMSTTSERVLKERAAELSAVNSEQLSKILDPLQDDLRQMRSQTEKMQKDHNDSLLQLKAAIQVNMERERAMGEQTERLAQALTGQSKIQGNFGELKLTQILEQMELERGLQYDTQETMRDEQGRTITSDEGRRMVPDAVLHFPDGRDVIIDSKMSFTAFVDYQNAETDAERDAALRRHLASMRQHVRELAQKQYFRYAKSDKGRLDFVLMYVFQESALQLALQSDTTLWKEAYDQGVVISGSQSLYMTLRVLELTWKQTRQVENQEKMMQCANTLVERVQLFAERFARVGEMLDKTRRSFDDLNTVTAPSGPSITTAARNLLKFGAQENKKKKSLHSSSLLEEKEEGNDATSQVEQPDEPSWQT